MLLLRLITYTIVDDIDGHLSFDDEYPS